jgi:hypothetical protein
MIRLPARYESQIIEYARLLDSDSESEAEPRFRLSQIESHVAEVLLSLRPGERMKALALFKKLTKRLQG